MGFAGTLLYTIGEKEVLSSWRILGHEGKVYSNRAWFLLDVQGTYASLSKGTLKGTVAKYLSGKKKKIRDRTYLMRGNFFSL